MRHPTRQAASFEPCPGCGSARHLTFSALPCSQAGGMVSSRVSVINRLDGRFRSSRSHFSDQLYRSGHDGRTSGDFWRLSIFSTFGCLRSVPPLAHPSRRSLTRGPVAPHAGAMPWGFIEPQESPRPIARTRARAGRARRPAAPRSVGAMLPAGAARRPARWLTSAGASTGAAARAARLRAWHGCARGTAAPTARLRARRAPPGTPSPRSACDRACEPRDGSITR